MEEPSAAFRSFAATWRTVDHLSDEDYVVVVEGVNGLSIEERRYLICAHRFSQSNGTMSLDELSELANGNSYVAFLALSLVDPVAAAGRARELELE